MLVLIFVEGSRGGGGKTVLVRSHDTRGWVRSGGVEVSNHLGEAEPSPGCSWCMLLVGY